MWYDMEEEQLFWGLVRQALLMLVDAIERCKLRLPHRTADLRKEARAHQNG